MSCFIDRLLMRIADALDRSLVTVPELDDDWPRMNNLTSPANTKTSSAPISLSRGRQSVKSSRFTQHRKASR
jgi:hypothetical protein